MKKNKTIFFILTFLSVFLITFFFKSFFEYEKIKGIAVSNEKRYEKQIGTTKIILRIRPAKLKEKEFRTQHHGLRKKNTSFFETFSKKIQDIFQAIFKLF